MTAPGEQRDDARSAAKGRPTAQTLSWLFNDGVVSGVNALVLGLFSAAALACVVLYGRNIPLVEDWYTVGLLTGNDHDLLGWAWEQTGEHRTPLARLVLLGAAWKP